MVCRGAQHGGVVLVVCWETGIDVFGGEFDSHGWGVGNGGEGAVVGPFAVPGVGIRDL